MRLILAPEAARDLQAIADHIAVSDVDAAIRLVTELQSKARNLTTMPHAFPLVPGLRHRGIRKRRHGQYLILYLVVGETVRVARIVHARRDYTALFI